MSQITKRILITTMTVIVLLTACFPAPQVTQVPADLANQVATAVALTVSAGQTQTQAAQPIPTNTTLPTQTDSAPPTATPNLPTATPFVIIPPTSTRSSGGGGGGGGAVATASLYDCTPVNNEPRDNTIFNRGDEFDIRWTIRNTGTRPIPARHDIKYFSGPVLMRNPNDTFREFGSDLAPGDSVTIIIDAVAPSERGFHVMTWVVEGNMCYPYVAIIVE